MKAILLILVVFMLFVHITEAQIACDAKPAGCTGAEIDVLGMTSTANALAELPSESNYLTRICCTGIDSINCNPASGDPTDKDIFLRLSGTTNAAVEKDFVGIYSEPVCMSKTPQGVTCNYYNYDNTDAGKVANPCGLVSETCIVTMMSATPLVDPNTNAWIAECGNLGTSYPIAVCCMLGKAPVVTNVTATPHVKLLESDPDPIIFGANVTDPDNSGISTVRACRTADCSDVNDLYCNMHPTPRTDYYACDLNSSSIGAGQHPIYIIATDADGLEGHGQGEDFYLDTISPIICDNDGVCEPPVESCVTCPQDCGSLPICSSFPCDGNGVCNGEETCETCPADCTVGCSVEPLPIIRVITENLDIPAKRIPDTIPPNYTRGMIARYLVKAEFDEGINTYNCDDKTCLAFYDVDSTDWNYLQWRAFEDGWIINFSTASLECNKYYNLNILAWRMTIPDAQKVIQEKFYVNCVPKVIVQPPEKRLTLGDTDPNLFTVTVVNPLGDGTGTRSFNLVLEPAQVQNNEFLGWMKFQCPPTNCSVDGGNNKKATLTINSLSEKSLTVNLDVAGRAGSYPIKFTATDMSTTAEYTAIGGLLIFAENLDEFSLLQLAALVIVSAFIIGFRKKKTT